MYHSFSSWQLFSACPYSWWARYIGKREEKRPDSPALIKGRQQHQFMEEIVKNKTFIENKSKIAPMVYDEVYSLIKGSLSVKPEIDICYNFDGKVIKKDWNNANGVITKIDLLVVRPDGIYVIDYKTGSSNGKIDQLKLYAKPFNSTISASFCYLDKNDVESYIITPKDVEKTWVEFLKYVDYTKDKTEEKHYSKVENTNCRWCCVKDCPLAKGL